MATRQEEAFLDHTTTVAIAACSKCSREEHNWDEMDLVKNLIAKGWVVYDGRLLCFNCRSDKHTSSTGHKFDTIKMDDTILDKNSPVVKPKIYIPK